MENENPLTIDDLKIKDRNKVNLRYNCLKIIDIIIERMYSKNVLILMEKQGYSVEEKDIEEARKTTKKNMVERHIKGKTIKELRNALSELGRDLDTLTI
jgi:hypothetical protein